MTEGCISLEAGNISAILTPANLYLYSKKQVCWVYYHEHFYVYMKLKIPMGTKVNFYQETGIFNI